MTNKADTWSEAPGEVASFPAFVNTEELADSGGGFGHSNGKEAFCGVEGGDVPPNSRELSLLSHTESIAELGIDHLTVQFLVDDFDSSEGSWDWSSRYPSKRHNDGSFLRESYSRRVEIVPGAEALVKVSVRKVGLNSFMSFGFIEFNPARVVNSQGYGLATVEDTLGALTDAVKASTCVLTPVNSDEWTSYKIRRIDVARDFHGVRFPSALIRGLAPIHRKSSRVNAVYSDPLSAGAQTLIVGTQKSGLVRLYDKSAQTKGAVEPGTVRWEVQARQEWATRYGGLQTIEDLALRGIHDLARNRWEWSAMGSEVTSIAGMVSAVLSLGLKEHQATTFVGYLVRQAAFCPWILSPSPAKKYRDLQGDLGIVVTAGAIDSLLFSSRLDWESSTEIVSVGAEGK